MGVEYGLYETSGSKEFIWLGKRFLPHGFQISSVKIVEFLCCHRIGKFEMHDDCRGTPNEDEKGWIEVANWCDDDSKPEGG